MTDNESRVNGSQEMWWEDKGRRASVVSAKHLDFSCLCLVNSNALSGIQRAGYCMMRYGHNVLCPSVEDKSSSAGCYAATIDREGVAVQQIIQTLTLDSLFDSFQGSC